MIPQQLNATWSERDHTIFHFVFTSRPLEVEFQLLILLKSRRESGGEPLAAPRGVSDASRRCKQRPSKFFVGGMHKTTRRKGWSLRLQAPNQIEGPVFAVDGMHNHSRRNTHRAWILEEGFRLSRGHQDV